MRLNRPALALFIVIYIALVVLLPRPYSTFLLVIAAQISLYIILTSRLHNEIQLPTFNLSLPLRYGLEIGLIVLCIFYFTRHLQDFSVNTRLYGAEFSYLINSGAIASEVYQRTGAIPLWNPLMRQGEPLVENPFSFVLNPLMMLPMLFMGTLPGIKLATLLHIFLMGMGGWMLAYILGLRAPGRLLLALLLAGCGSMTGLIGEGFIQLGLSQAYVPWVFAGLIGTLRREERWTIGLLAIATTLMIFSGTFWYVMPTAISCAMVVVFHLVKWERHPRINVAMLRRLMWAAAFTVGLSAARLLPQLIYHDFILHPNADLNYVRFDFILLLRAYFEPVVVDGLSGGHGIHYHYVLPSALLLVIVPGLVFGFRRFWRIMLPALLLIGFFTMWAQEGTVFVKALYRTFSFLSEWRYLGRMLAAGAPWLAVLAAIGFDEAARVVGRGSSTNITRIFLAALIIFSGGIAAADVMLNWKQTASFVPVTTPLAAPIGELRERNPDGFLTVQTAGFFDYLPFYRYLVRSSFGMPEYTPAGLPSTIETAKDILTLRFEGEYALADKNLQTTEMLAFRHYRAIEDSKFLFPWWRYSDSLTYAFIVDQATLADESTPLIRSRTQPVTTFTHQMDRIVLHVADSRPDKVLVVQETAYPGWQVFVDGERSRLESAGGLLAIILPDRPSLTIEFRYVPVWLYVGGTMTVISALVLVGYLLRLDYLLAKRPANS